MEAFNVVHFLWLRLKMRKKKKDYDYSVGGFVINLQIEFTVQREL